MSAGWESDKRWSDRFLPELKRILGEHLIGEPPVQEDMERNTDLIVLRMDAVRIACRVRKYAYLRRYPNEFTIRAGRPSGAKTELTKIVEGWGDFLIYGFSDAAERDLAAWTLVDLSALRLWVNRHMATHGGKLPCSIKPNVDGSSTFAAFSLATAPDGLVVARKPAERQAA